VPNFTLNSGTTAEKLAKTIRGLLFFAAPCMCVHHCQLRPANITILTVDTVMICITWTLIVMAVLLREETQDAGWLCPRSTEKLESIHYIVRFPSASLNEQWQVTLLLRHLCLLEISYQCS